jgi:hypothetical protein
MGRGANANGGAGPALKMSWVLGGGQYHKACREYVLGCCEPLGLGVAGFRGVYSSEKCPR